MHLKNRLFWFCFTGMICLILAVVFLPRYVSRSLDFRNLNRVEISKREDFSFLEQGSNDISETIWAFQYLGKEEGNPVLLTSMEEPVQVSSELLERLYGQAMMASECGMLPWIGPFYKEAVQSVDGENELMVTEDWISCIKTARYYALTYESRENVNKKELLNIWYLRFSDDQQFDYSFVINAVTSEIYYARIHNADTYSQVKENDEMGKYAEYASQVGYLFAQGCASYYGGFADWNAVGQTYLFQKLCLALLYLEDGQTVYIEKSIVDADKDVIYPGVRIGFQDVVNWVKVSVE